MKKINFNMILFIATLFLLGGLNLLGIGKSNTSELENRVQRQKPVFTVKGLFSGEFFKAYEDYYSDNFVLRDRLLNIGSSIKQFRGLANSDGASIV